jgi:E3 Ubiquitin ligase
VNVCLSLFIPMNYLTLLSLFAIAGGLYFFSIGFQLLARKRLLLMTPTSRIRSAAMGLVEVNGTATGPHTMPAPITGKLCFLYHTTAWQQREGKKQEWEKVADETLHLPFFLDDTTGQLLIEPLGADLDLHRYFREEYATSIFSSTDDIPPRVRAFLSRQGIASTRPLRIDEYSIKPDDMLFIAGTLTENPGVEIRGFSSHVDSSRNAAAHNIAEQAPAPQIVRLYGGANSSSAQGMSQQAKIAAALTRAGITKPEAWSAAGVPYGGLAVEENPAPVPSRTGTPQSSANESPGGAYFDDDQAEPSAVIPAPPVVLMKGANDPTFVISFRSQKEFVSALAWKSAGMISGGIAIILLGLYILLAQMGSL